MLNALYQHRINYLKSRMSVQMAWQGETESIVHVFESSRLMPERVFDELVVIAFSTENQHLKDYLAKDTRWVVSLQDAKKVSSKSNNSVVYNGIIAYEQSLQPSVASSWLRNQFVAVWPRVAQWISSTQTQNQPKATLIEDHIIAPQAKTQTYELSLIHISEPTRPY